MRAEAARLRPLDHDNGHGVGRASIATVGPVWSASRIRIADTLRYE
jgi:hypothetical protein